MIVKPIRVDSYFPVKVLTFIFVFVASPTALQKVYESPLPRGLLSITLKLRVLIKSCIPEILSTKSFIGLIIVPTILSDRRATRAQQDVVDLITSLARASQDDNGY